MLISFLGLCAFNDMTQPVPSYIELDRIFIERELSYVELHFSQLDILFHGSSLFELFHTMSMPEVVFEWFITGDVVLRFFYYSFSSPSLPSKIVFTHLTPIWMVILCYHPCQVWAMHIIFSLVRGISVLLWDIVCYLIIQTT